MGRKILVVDDSMIVRVMLKKILILSGIKISEIAEAANGVVAYDLLKNEKVSLLMTDINMPEMDGIALISKVREEEELKEIPIIIISSHGGEKMDKELEGKNIFGYIKKPFIHEDIRELVNKCLGE